ncbi:alpha/beta fold hydrolase [Specibacter sp. NPDC057265]|uniref:alpha/beta fold hydrolase n=1 Tax=Specibacter sp. NPDC057265 TaxID=3346075 RepID=UPI0036364518
MRTEFLRIHGQELYSEVAGAGEPVLLLHGGFCSLENLRELANTLMQEYQVFAYERPGHGRSADLAGDYSYARGLTDTLAYLDAQGLKSVHVVGYSDGAILGLLLALEHPERVRSLVAVSANLDPDVFTPAAGDGPRLDAPPPSAAVGEQEPDLERLHYGRLSPDGAGHAEVVLAKLMRLWTTEPRIEPARLASITAPTLIMSGDRDSIPPAHSLLMAASIPGAQLAIVPGTGHGLIAQRPELIHTLIRDFLAQV